MFGLGLGHMGQERVLGRSLAATLSENFLETSMIAEDQVLLDEFLQSFARLFNRTTGSQLYVLLQYIKQNGSFCW